MRRHAEHNTRLNTKILIRLVKRLESVLPNAVEYTIKTPLSINIKYHFILLTFLFREVLIAKVIFTCSFFQ